MWRPTPFTLLVIGLVTIFSAAVIVTTVSFVEQAASLQAGQAAFFRKASAQAMLGSVPNPPPARRAAHPIKMTTADEVTARRLAIGQSKHVLAKLKGLVSGETACDKIQTSLGTFTQCDNGAVGVAIAAKDFSGSNDFTSKSGAAKVGRHGSSIGGPRGKLNGQPIKDEAKCYARGYFKCKKPCAWNSHRRICVVPTPSPTPAATPAPVFIMSSSTTIHLIEKKGAPNLTQTDYANILNGANPKDLTGTPTEVPSVNVSATWESSYTVNLPLGNPATSASSA